MRLVSVFSRWNVDPLMYPSNFCCTVLYEHTKRVVTGLDTYGVNLLFYHHVYQVQQNGVGQKSLLTNGNQSGHQVRKHLSRATNFSSVDVNLERVVVEGANVRKLKWYCTALCICGWNCDTGCYLMSMFYAFRHVSLVFYKSTHWNMSGSN